MGKYFGTDGFRGEANVSLTAEHAFRIGSFLGWYYGSGRDKSRPKGYRPRIVIGKDTRRSGYMLEDAFSSGACASGADVYLLHVTTTPCVSYAARTESFDCGVMISASHNAFYDNGIKLINGSGEKMKDEVIEDVEAFLDGNYIPDGGAEGWKVPLATGEDIGRVIDYFSGRNRYVGYLISLADSSYRGIKAGLDCANGSAWQIAKNVFDALGAKTYVINNTPDGINVNKNCGSTHIEGLRKLVKDEHLDVGFAFDGDADRCLAVDENGEVVNGDKIIYLCARRMKENGILKNTRAVTTVMSNMGLYKALDEIGIGYRKTPVGDKYVYESMVKNGDLIGGEQSGHIIFRKYATTGDGIITAIKVMECMLETNEPLSKLAEPVSVYPQVLKNAIVSDRELALLDPGVKKAVSAQEERLGSGGRVLLRASGTESVLRVMSEALTAEDAERAVDAVIAAMDAAGMLLGVK